MANKSPITLQQLEMTTTAIKGVIDGLEDVYAPKSAVGGPLLVTAAADMTDTSKIYVYIGSETGMVHGHWYYFSAGSWVDGGAYDSILVDDTLTQAGEAADSKKVGDEIDRIDDELETKANVDGYYVDLGAGRADQLVATTGVEDNAPYVFRRSGGNLNIGDREDDEVHGGSIVWNQLVQNGNFANGTTGWSSTATISADGGVLTMLASAKDQKTSKATQRVSGHVYFDTADIKTTSTEVRFHGSGSVPAQPSGTGAWERLYVIGVAGTTGGVSRPSITDKRSSSWDSIQVRNVYSFDLTAMFGPVIADYVYNLEQTTTGAGVAWVRKLFPKDYYAYNTGTMAHVQTSAHETTGFNQWDEEWEVGNISDQGVPTTSSDFMRAKNFIHVFPNMDYKWTSLSGNLGRLFFYDASQTFISYRISSSTGLFTTPENAHFLKFRMAQGYGTTYKNDVCINISNDGSRNGEYEPYVKHTYPLDDSLILRGVPKLDENDRLYYDGDIYNADGTVTRRYGIVDLGTLTWGVLAGDLQYFYATVSDLKTGFSGAVDFLICEKYGNASATGKAAIEDKQIGTGSSNGVSSSQIVIADSAYSDSATFKAAISGSYLVYELAEPTTEQADPYIGTQVTDSFGTERYVDVLYEDESRDFEMLVGHKTFYQQNLRDKLQSAPNNPDSDGTFLVKRADGENTYMPFDTNSKANTSGVYPDFVAGNAEQFTTKVGVNDAVPYNFRTAGGSAEIGNRVDETVVGGSIGWNQLAPFNATSTSGGVTFTNDGNGKLTASGEITDAGAMSFINSSFGAKNPVISGHVYVFAVGSFTVSGTEAPVRIRLRDSTNNTDVLSLLIGTDYPFGLAMCKAITSGNMSYYINWGATTVGGTITGEINPQVFDLTAMFGSTIADYVYGLETANAGAGVAWFRKLFPADYYAYNAGAMAHVQTSTHETTGFNQWDEEWEPGGISATTGQNTNDPSRCRSKNYIPVLSGMEYSVTRPEGMVLVFLYYGATKNYLRYQSVNTTGAFRRFTPPDDVCFIRMRLGDTTTPVTSLEGVNICINLSWDGSRNGEYEPYVKHVYPLDDSLTLRGIPKLDANNKLYFDGDVYKADGTVTRRYGIVDLGTLTWTRSETTTQGLFIFSATVTGKASGYNMLCDKYETIAVTSIASMTDKTIKGHSTAGRDDIYVRDDSYTDAATFKAAMSGAYLVYELATPTTEEADAYDSQQIVDDFGTEQYVDYAYEAGNRDFDVPVGHDSLYQANLKAKLEMSPNSPDGDGDYIVRQSGGMNTYVPLAEVKELPDAPTEDGTYTLKCTVSGGVATLAWVAD